MTQKSLTRLFPCDTSMVVIIDDRADVWQWSANLLKVIPCEARARACCRADARFLLSTVDFYVGIGDINAAFLPKKSSLEAHKPQTSSDDGPDSPPYESLASTPSSSSENGTTMSEVHEAASKAKAAEDTLRHQVADRPLQQAQDKIEAQHAKELENGLEVQLEATQSSTATQEEAVLKEDDRELDRLFEVRGAGFRGLR
jgi:RNA polymerase II subunit A-like phosphatase